MAEFDNMTAESFIAAFIESNGGVLVMTKAAIANDYKDRAIQIAEDPTKDIYIFTLIDANSIQEVNNGSETLSDSDGTDSDLS